MKELSKIVLVCTLLTGLLGCISAPDIKDLKNANQIAKLSLVMIKLNLEAYEREYPNSLDNSDYLNVKNGYAAMVLIHDAATKAIQDYETSQNTAYTPEQITAMILDYIAQYERIKGSIKVLTDKRK